METTKRYLRRGVGVEFGLETKKAGFRSGSGLKGDRVLEPLAHQIPQGFQRFWGLTNASKSIHNRGVAQPNLEKYISQGFQMPAIAIDLNPY